MTQTGYTNAIVNMMLGWLKTVAGWVLRFFHLYGGASPIDFLMKNWWKLLGILLILGVVMDLVVWILRWRPHWVWFGKKRVVINDKNFFAREQYADDEESDALRGTYVRPERNWVDNDFIVKGRVPVKNKKPVNEEKPNTDVFTDEKFSVDARHRFADRYEDEVFNVSDLPDTPVNDNRKKKEKKQK